MNLERFRMGFRRASLAASYCEERHEVRVGGLGAWSALGSIVLLSAFCLTSAVGARTTEVGDSGYEDLVRLFEEWREFQRPEVRAGVADYTTAAMAEQSRGLGGYRERLAAIDPEAWPASKRIDYELVRAELNGLDFDHRVLRPWARDPAFYRVVVGSESDTPLTEGAVMEGAIELWRLSFPLRAADLMRFGASIEAIPTILEQARGNLVGNSHDLWRLGILTQQGQSKALTDLANRLSEIHPQVVPGLERARTAVDAFVAWLEEKLPEIDGPSGVGIENYDWYLRHVHLIPSTWQEELWLMERELARSVAHLALAEHRNRDLPPLQPAGDVEQWERVAGEAIEDFLSFLGEEVLQVEEYMGPALRERIAPYAEPGSRHFFNQVDLRDPRVMRCHHMHWIDKARMREEPHPSPIRRLPSLYNIWDSRSEGLATAMEEMMLTAGLFADSPHSRELVYIMIAQRAARAIAGLRVQSNEWSVEEAVLYAAEKTPRGWFRAHGDLVLFEQQLYLRQPGYGTSYLTGKALIESLLAERRLQLGDDFTLKGFMEELLGAGMIPVSLIRWEMTGRE